QLFSACFVFIAQVVEEFLVTQFKFHLRRFLFAPLGTQKLHFQLGKFYRLCSYPLLFFLSINDALRSFGAVQQRAGQFFLTVFVVAQLLSGQPQNCRLPLQVAHIVFSCLGFGLCGILGALGFGSGFGLCFVGLLLGF